MSIKVITILNLKYIVKEIYSDRVIIEKVHDLIVTNIGIFNRTLLVILELLQLGRRLHCYKRYEYGYYLSYKYS